MTSSLMHQLELKKSKELWKLRKLWMECVNKDSSVLSILFSTIPPTILNGFVITQILATVPMFALTFGLLGSLTMLYSNLQLTLRRKRFQNAHVHLTFLTKVILDKLCITFKQNFLTVSNFTNFILLTSRVSSKMFCRQHCKMLIPLKWISTNANLKKMDGSNGIDSL